MKYTTTCLLVSLLSSTLSFAQNGGKHTQLSQQTHLLSLRDAVSLAIENDPWLEKSRYQQAALEAKAISVSSLPDPKLNFGMMNMPVDGFDLAQEPMTQMVAGISQAFPRGDSRSLESERQGHFAEQQTYFRLTRQAQLAVQVSHLYLDALQAKMAISLIEQDKVLFEQLGEIAQAGYASALGNTRQQDIVRAELELMRIEDRLLQLQSDLEYAVKKLREWLHAPSNSHVAMRDLPTSMPSIDIAALAQMINGESSLNTGLAAQDLARLIHDQTMLAQSLQAHPTVLAVEQGIKAKHTAIQLAKQKFKPQWGVNASYAYRQDDNLGRDRADFLSIGLSVDLPLFTENRQDKDLQAAISESEAIKTEKRLVLRELMAELKASFAKQARLKARSALYTTRILAQSEQQAELALNAYTNNDGDFAEVLRSRMAQLNAHLEALNIETQLLKTNISLGYFLVTGEGLSKSLTLNNRDKQTEDGVLP